MKDRLRTVKASMIVGLLFISIFIALAPSSSAQEQGLFKFEPYLEMNILNTEDTVGIVPADPIDTTIKLDFRYKIAGILGSWAQNVYERYSVDARLQISLGEIPSYCSAYLFKQSTSVPITTDFLSADDEITMGVRFLKEAPQQQTVSIPVHVKAAPTSAFPFTTLGVEEIFYVPVTPTYIPIIDAYPKKDLLEVAPGEIAVFEIDLENQGNQLTEFRFVDLDFPDGWTAAIVSETKIDSAQLGGESKKTVRLQVTPPYNFGYHDEQEQITVTVQGFYFAGTNGQNTSSSPVPIRVIVRNRGFSFQPGVEMAAIIIIIIVLLVLAFLLRTRVRKK
jgi:hypothetical protein